MASFRIVGGKVLKGEIVPQGAKNEALQVLCATLLTDEPVIIRNIPDIEDVNRLIELLVRLGVRKEPAEDDGIRFQTGKIDTGYLETPDYIEKAASIRGSIMIIGPLLARLGRARLPKPGGDKIGRRRLDTHFSGLNQLGADFSFDFRQNMYSVRAKRLQGTYIHLEEASVTGTANLLMAASLAEGKTVIYNAACEPYIQQLCHMLNRMGARISGIGSNLLSVEGVRELHGTTHELLPDMIEVGSFIGMAAMTQSALTIRNAGVRHLGLIPGAFEKLGIRLEISSDDIFIPAQEHYEVETFIDGSIMTLADAIWPGLSPDLLSVLLVVATQARGTVLIHQKMFESRLFFVDKLIDMGAQIILCDPHRATVIGLDRTVRLRGIRMTSPDIRAGVALLIAALSAEGTSEMLNIEQIDRGYQHIDQRLRALGAQIERTG